MPAYEETTSRGGYVPFQLKRDYHLDIFGNAVDKIAQQHEKALQQQSQIRLALDQLNLNEAEDEFKQNYINNVMNQIDNAARFGNYSGALDTAIRLAGEAATDPNITGRVRANEQYQAKRKEVEALAASGKINDITKERWLAQNQYNYVPVTDSYGRVVGSKNWEDVGFNGNKIWNPVQNVDITKLGLIAENFVKPEKKTWSGQSTDEEGFSTGGGGSYERVTENRLDAALNAAFESAPGARESLMQDFKDNQWLIEKLKQDKNNTQDPAERDRLQREIDDIFDTLYKREGDRIIELDAKEYMTKRISPLLHEAAYNNTTNHSVSKAKSTPVRERLGLTNDTFPTGMYNYGRSAGAAQVENMERGSSTSQHAGMPWSGGGDNSGQGGSSTGRQNGGASHASNALEGY